MNTIRIIDEKGMEYSHCYAPCLFDNGQNPTSTVYSDRLLQWDYDKHNELCRKHFGNEGQYWKNRQPEKIEAFLRDWMNDQSVVLCRIEEHTNQSNGYLLWRFDYLHGA